MPPKPAADPVVPSPDPVPDPARKAGRAMAFSLKCLLDKVPGAREVLPYLAALERALSADGTAVLEVIPPASLRKMGAQLAALPLDLDDRPLRALQVQVQSAIARRASPAPASAPVVGTASLSVPPPRPAPPRPDPLPYLPSSLDEGKLEVTEVSQSEWAAASQIMEDGPGRDA